MNWIRDSKDLINAAEVVLIGIRQEERDGNAKRYHRYFKVEKVKNGPVGFPIDLIFEEHSARFVSSYPKDYMQAQMTGAELGEWFGDTDK